MREGMKKKILLVVFAVMAIFVWANGQYPFDCRVLRSAMY